MARPALVVATGFEQLDAKLRAMPAALQRKLVRGGLRRAINRCAKEYQRIVKAEAFDTGVLAKAAKPKALKRSRKRFGFALLIEREKLFAQYARKHEGKAPHPAKGKKEPFYYPAAIEFGTPTQSAIKPMRRALYDSSDIYRAYFAADIREFIATQKVTTRLAKVDKGGTK